MQKVKVELSGNAHEYEIEIGRDLLNGCGEWAKKCLSEKARKIVVVSNPKIFRLYGEAAKNSLEKSGFEVSVWLMKDGERHKSFRSLEAALRFFSEIKLKRTDAVVALGGGVVGDLAGFAAAVYLRGIAFLQIPTTLLAMIDSSVGGKTAVNTEFGKNLIGAFHQPRGVLIDVDVLQTLPRRELTAGFCEAVKQGAIADEKLFNQTAGFLRNYSPPQQFKKFFSRQDFSENLQKLIAAQVAFKAEIVSQDERESADRSDRKSRKILNFGHTVGHALEKVTDYKRFKHGEAVGYGILAAAEISKEVANFVQDDIKSLNDVVRLAGNLPTADGIRIEDVIKAISFDKKSIGESLQWILLEKIGNPKIFSDRDIPKTVIEKSLRKIFRT
ncbi:MAG: 3-dehydroquinate synthase [Acidobacteriota bacterium]|nr:3-dehydroquinate synthase [Acidobacteriota bacterium]